MSPGPNLSVVLITRNEARALERALSSVTWAPDIVVLDSESTDATRAVAERMGARVFTRPFTDYSEQRNAALTRARGDWVLFLDADEFVRSDCAREIQRIVGQPWSEGRPVAYEIPFRNYIGTRWLRHGGLFPDYHMRLFRRELGTYRGRVHETLQVEGPKARVTGAIDHFTYRDLDHLLEKVDRHAPKEGRDRARAGESPWLLLLRVPCRFLQVYLVRGGFRDGKLGLAHAAALMRYSWIVYRSAVRQYERSKSRGRGEGGTTGTGRAGIGGGGGLGSSGGERGADGRSVSGANGGPGARGAHGASGATWGTGVPTMGAIGARPRPDLPAARRRNPGRS